MTHPLAVARARSLVALLWLVLFPCGLAIGFGWQAVAYVLASVVALAAAWHLTGSAPRT
jgi:hypothetical protein